MSKLFDVSGAPGTALQIRPLSRTGLSELVGRDFIIHKVRSADEIFEYCDIARIDLEKHQGALRLVLVVERSTSKEYEVPIAVIDHAGHHLWLKGTDGQGREIFVFLKTDGQSPDNKPCLRIRVLVFPTSDQRAKPDQYSYTEITTKPPEPLEPACDRGDQELSTLEDEDEESEGYFER